MIARLGLFKTWLGIVVLLCGISAHAQPRQIPALSAPVIDETGILTSRERATLDAELRRYPPAAQLQIWIVDSLADEPIESLSIRAADTWKLGTNKEDRGVLLLIALRDRRMRIEVGQGLEGEITDLQSGRILDDTLRPALRSEQYFEGILQTSRQIYQLAGGQTQGLAPRTVQTKGKRPSSVFFLFLLFVFLLRIFGGGGRRRSLFYGALGASAFGGSRRGWGGGGGGWSGGGGGFSGGGSSGSW